MIEIQTILTRVDRNKNKNTNNSDQGWQKYRGGLDVRGDMTGTHSVYTTQVLVMIIMMMVMVVLK